MPSGKSHSAIASYAASGSILLWCALDQPMTGIWMALGIIIGDSHFSPDLDQEVCDALNRWGVFRPIWGWYSSLPHRSIISHGPGIADVIRVGYVALMLGALLMVWMTIVRSVQAKRVDLLSGVLAIFEWIRIGIGPLGMIPWAEYRGLSTLTVWANQLAAYSRNLRPLIAFFIGMSINTGLHAFADWWTNEPDMRKRKSTARPARREMRKAA